MTREIKEIAHSIKSHPPAVRYRQGKVIGVNPLVITLGGSDVPIPAAPALGTYTPKIGHTVHVLRYADTVLVLGTS